MNTTAAIEQVATDIKNTLAPVFAGIEADTFETFDDAETPGLQFNATILGRNARVTVTLMPTGDFKVYIFNRETGETMYTRTGVEEEDLADVFAEDLQVTLTVEATR